MKLQTFLATCQVIQNVGTTFIPSRAPAIPLAVRSPYMNTWLEVGSGGSGNLSGAWPRFWAGSQPGDVTGSTGAVTAWTGLIKVDGVSYTWMGDPQVNGVSPTNVVQHSVEFTAQRSTFLMTVANRVSMNVTFISPVTPNDLKRQSIIGTYLEVTVASIDAVSHSVQLYTDISAEWVSIHNTDIAQWSLSHENGVISHKSWRQSQSEFNADYHDDAAHWGSYYWSTAATPSTTYQSGADVTVRQAFLGNGRLPNTQDTNYRAINNAWPVFAFASDLGSVGDTAIATVYTIVHAQQNAVLFNGANGNAPVPSLWTSYFNSDLALVEFFYKDFLNVSGAIDQKIAIDSLAAGGQDYATITTLSTRQAFAAVQLTGTLSKPYMFLKEISSNGNTQTVDVVFPSIPIFLYLNPTLLKYLLEPLYENQESGHWPHTYAIHDIGTHYPQAIGHPDGNAEEMPVEECGNMIISSLAYAQRANDIDYLKQHYAIMKQWAGYLITDSLIPGHQLSTDDFQGALENQTNLALKGIIAIKAMGQIANLTGNSEDSANYNEIAQEYIGKWEGFAVVDSAQGKHTKLAYQDGSSHGLLYNIYADKLLNLNFVPQNIYDMQSAFYPTIAQKYGVQLDTRNFYTKTDWEIWSAATTSPSTKQMFISKLANWISETSSNRAFTDLHHTQTGDFAVWKFIARPVVGGHFALLALP